MGTTFGDKYFVAPYSVSRHIAQINEFNERTTSRDEPRLVATPVAPQASRAAAAPTPPRTQPPPQQPAPPPAGPRPFPPRKHAVKQQPRHYRQAPTCRDRTRQ